MATKTSTEKGGSSKRWTEAEKDAMKERAKELKTQSRRSPAQEREEGERELQAKIAEMPASDRAMAERLHEIILATAPELTPRTWYGMPAWASNGKALCFFTPAAKFKERYATFGFNADAQLDEGTMWPTSWALTSLSAADEKTIAALVKKAVG